MKKFGLFLCLSLLFAFTGCSDSDNVEDQGGGTTLAKPAVAVTTTTSSSFKVEWSAVPNAEGYKYQLSQESETGGEHLLQPETTTSATALAFSDLEPETKYILRVKAFANGVSDSEYAKVFATTLSEKQPELTFDKIAVSNITYESVDVEIVPAAENLYYWQVVENTLVEGKSDREVVAALKSNISELASGTVKKTVYGLDPETKYTIVAFGYDLDKGSATSAVARLENPFTTARDTRMSIAITVGTPTSTSVNISFKPSESSAAYFADVVLAADVEGKTDLEIVALLQQKYTAAMTDIAHTGDYAGDIALKPAQDYLAVAFGYDVTAAELTSKMATQSFSSKQLDGSTIFTVTASNPSSSTIDFSVTTTDPEIYYFPVSLPTAVINQATSEELVKEIISLLNTYCDKFGFDTVATNLLGKGNMNDKQITGLDPNTAYKVMTLGVEKVSDKAAKAITTLVFSNEVTTLPDEVATDNPWADLIPSFENQGNNSYGIFVDFKPNEKATTIRGGAWPLTGDATSLEQIGLTESSLRSRTLGSEGVDVDMAQGYIGRRCTLGQAWLFSAVAKNAKGEAGKVNWIIIKAPTTADGDVTILAQSEDNDSGGGSIQLKNASYEDYIGNWTLTSSGTITISGNQVSSSNDPITHNLKIEENVKDKSYKVYGWSGDTEFANANPFVMNYDATVDSGISGWVLIPLAQKLQTEGNIDWMLCARFIGGNSSGGNSYYFYDSTNMDEAFFGATEASGAVIIMGNTYEFNDPIGKADILAMSFVGVDKTNPDADVQARPLENKHAVAPYVLIKKGSPAATSAAKKMQLNRKAANLSHLATMHQNFARLSSASAIGNPYAKMLKQAILSHELPAIQTDHTLNVGTDIGIRPYLRTK